jgi:hypothetical protein
MEADETEEDPSSWTQIELRMAFYAGVIKHGKLTVSPEAARSWRATLPRAIEEEYERIDRGELPRRLTVSVVLRSNHDPGAVQTTASERPAGPR